MRRRHSSITTTIKTPCRRSFDRQRYRRSFCSALSNSRRFYGQPSLHSVETPANEIEIGETTLLVALSSATVFGPSSISYLWSLPPPKILVSPTNRQKQIGLAKKHDFYRQCSEVLANAYSFWFVLEHPKRETSSLFDWDNYKNTVSALVWPSTLPKNFSFGLVEFETILRPTAVAFRRKRRLKSEKRPSLSRSLATVFGPSSISYLRSLPPPNILVSPSSR